VENHKDCKEVIVLGNITKNVKTSTMFNETEHLIKEMFENIGKISQAADGLEIWRFSQIPQKDGELDMMLISCNKMENNIY
jgi:hypothetical protein